MKRLRLKSSIIENIEGSLFIAPWIIGFLVFVSFPLGYSIFMSFHDVKIVATGIQYKSVGWLHYRNILLSDGGLLYDLLLPFLREAIIMIPIIVVFSLLIAILLNQKFRGRMFFRAVFFLPVIFSSGQVIQEFITQGAGTASFVEQFKLASFVGAYLPEAWSTPIIAVLNSFVLILWYSGVQILIFLAGRQTISQSVYEAARIDGADPWATFWKITLPGLTPFILLNLIYTVVDLFTFPNNPIIASVTTQNYGLSSAIAWIYFMIILLFLGVAVLIFKRLGFTSNENR